MLETVPAGGMQWYMKVGDLRKALEGPSDDAYVYYERIEDWYFQPGKGCQGKVESSGSEQSRKFRFWEALTEGARRATGVSAPQTLIGPPPAGLLSPPRASGSSTVADAASS